VSWACAPKVGWVRATGWKVLPSVDRSRVGGLGLRLPGTANAATAPALALMLRMIVSETRRGPSGRCLQAAPSGDVHTASRGVKPRLARPTAMSFPRNSVTASVSASPELGGAAIVPAVQLVPSGERRTTGPPNSPAWPTSTAPWLVTAAPPISEKSTPSPPGTTVQFCPSAENHIDGLRARESAPVATNRPWSESRVPL
jgi:hypothetical protein